MKNFAVVAMLVGGCISVGLGIFLFIMKQTMGGITGLLAGISLISFGMSKKKENEYKKGISVFLQNINTVADLQTPISVIVKTNNTVKIGFELSIYLNGEKVGSFPAGEKLQFNARKEKNFLQIGKIEGEPFDNIECCCFFDAIQSQDEINFEISIEKIQGTPSFVLKRV